MLTCVADSWLGSLEFEVGKPELLQGLFIRALVKTATFDVGIKFAHLCMYPHHSKSKGIAIFWANEYEYLFN